MADGTTVRRRDNLVPTLAVGTDGKRLQDHNPNYVGGDIAGGAATAWRLAMRPVPRWDRYATPLPGVHAARRALRQRFAVDTDPIELVRVATSDVRCGVIAGSGDRGRAR